MSVWLPRKRRGRKLSRKWPGKRPRKLGWAKARSAAPGQTKEARVCDHVIPERWLLTWLPSRNPHDKENLMWLTVEQHGIKTGADAKFCRGNLLGYLETLRTSGWPMDRVEAALRHYNLR